MKRYCRRITSVLMGRISNSYIINVEQTMLTASYYRLSRWYTISVRIRLPEV